ncbi:MAG: RND family transporter [Bacteroidetes bacterium]|nr:RND family transporter [Bacteroidota bacterium]
MFILPFFKPYFVFSFAFIKNHKSYYRAVLLIVVLFSAFCLYRIQFLKFDYDFEAFFPNEDHELEVYNNYRKTFEHDNEFALIALENSKGIFNKTFLLRVDSLTKALNQLNYIQKITSPTNLKTLSLGGLIPTQTRALHIEDETLYKEDSIKIYQSPHLVGSFFPLNAKSLTIYIKTKDDLKKRQSDSLASNIEKVLSRFNFENIHYVGRIFAQQVYLDNLQKEFGLFLGLSFLVVILFLWFSFRSIYGIIVPVSIVLISIIWTLGVMSLVGKTLDIMTVMLPTMIFIAGMSDVVHFFSKYFEELAKGTKKEKIYPLILKEVGFPTLLTLITTVVGFLSLLFSSIRPIRDFGIYTSVGVIIAFILSYSLLPALLYFFTPKKLVSVHTHNNRTYRTMRSGLFWIFRNQKTILLITAVTIILSIIGISKIKVNNILLEDLSDKVKIKQDFNFFDANYSGVRPLEIKISVLNPKKNVWDYEVINAIDKVDEFIKKEYHAGFLISPSSLVKTVYLNSIDTQIKKFPSAEDYGLITKQFQENRKRNDLKKLVTVNGKTTRISAKISDMGSIKATLHNAHLLAFIENNVDSSLLKFEITGAAHLVDKNNEYMVNNMTQGFIFSLIVIAILTFFLHRSWRMVLVFIIPNVIPLLIIGGIMGFAGIELKAATSLVFSIAFGIATDDTIHFISRLKIELGYGKSLMYAFKRTYFETGKPIILTTFILLGGFMSLMISDFQSTFYFGFLICITVIIAVVADIFLLPVLLFMIYGKKKK